MTEFKGTEIQAHARWRGGEEGKMKEVNRHAGGMESIQHTPERRENRQHSERTEPKILWNRVRLECSERRIRNCKQDKKNKKFTPKHYLSKTAKNKRQREKAEK